MVALRPVGLSSGRAASNHELSTRIGPMSSGLVVVPAAANGVSSPARDQQYHADDEQDDPDGEQEMGESEGRDEAREEQPEDDEDDSENDHDFYLVSMGYAEIRWSRGSVFEDVF